MNKDIIYLTMYESKKFPGVEKKLKGFVSAASKINYNSSLVNIWTGSGFRNILNLSLAIIKSKDKNIFIRWPLYGSLILIPSIIISRIRGCIIYADIPTPRSTVLLEIKNNDLPRVKKLILTIKVILDGPWALWPTNKIIQYAPEGLWFSIFNKNKTILIGNGIDTESIQKRTNSPKFNESTIILIGVANVEDWHGYDRVIKGISKYNESKNKSIEIKFIIIGEGSAINKLKSITMQLNLESNVIFTGKITGDRLFSYYEMAHIGIGSLGLHRKKLTVASSLKDREYCAIGIPFIGAGKDPDFPESFLWRYTAPSTDEHIDFDKVIEWISKISPLNSIDIQNYAANNCDYKQKINFIMNSRQKKY